MWYTGMIISHVVLGQCVLNYTAKRLVKVRDAAKKKTQAYKIVSVPATPKQIIHSVKRSCVSRTIITDHEK